MEELIRQLIKREISLVIDLAKVIKVNDDTCHVESLTTEKDFFKCRLNAIEINENDHLKLSPAEGSTVVIGVFPDNDKAVIIAVSKVATIAFNVGNTNFTVDSAGYNVNRSGKNLNEQLNKLLDAMVDQNTKIQELSSKVAAIVVAQGVGPDVPGLSALNQELSQIALDTDTELRDGFNTILIADG